MLTTVLDLLGAVLLVACAYFIFWPAALGLAGVLLLTASWKANR